MLRGSWCADITRYTTAKAFATKDAATIFTNSSMLAYFQRLLYNPIKANTVILMSTSPIKPSQQIAKYPSNCGLEGEKSNRSSSAAI